MHQAPGARDDVVLRPDGQLIVADRVRRFECQPARALKPVGAAAGPPGIENVVAAPLLLDLQNTLAALSGLCCRVGLAEVLMIDAQMSALVDIGFGHGISVSRCLDACSAVNSSALSRLVV